jgi:hypothetical protein
MIFQLVATVKLIRREVDALKAELHRREDEEDCQKAHIVANWIRHRAIKQQEPGEIFDFSG